MFPLSMAQEIRIEIWQQANQWTPELGLRQLVEVLTKRGCLPAFHIYCSNAGLLAPPDCAGIREGIARPHGKVCGGGRTKRLQIPAQESPLGLFPGYILPFGNP